MPTVTILSAGTGSPSQCSTLAGCFAGEFRRSPISLLPQLTELRTLASPILHASLTGEADTDLGTALLMITQADALVMITPLHNGSYSGLFKMFVDLIDPPALRGKPVVLAASAGSTRSTLALDGPIRSLFGSFRMLVAPTVVLATPSDWASAGVPGTELGQRVARAAAELGALIGCPVR